MNNEEGKPIWDKGPLNIFCFVLFIRIMSSNILLPSSIIRV